MSERDGAADDLSLDQRPEKILLFSVGGEAHAVDLDRIRLVQPADEIRPLPQAPENVVGMVEGLDEAVPVVDLAAVLGETGSGSPEHVLIYNSTKGLVGFVVDEALGVVNAVRAPLPQTLRRRGACLVALAKHGDETAYMLELEPAVPGPGVIAATRGGGAISSDASES